MTSAAIEIILAWHAALHEANIGQLVSISTPDVAVGGPRGVAKGTDVLRDWATRSGIDLEPRRFFGRGDVVVVDQAARWRSTDGQVAEPQDVASVFHTQDGRVSSVIRYADLRSALEAAGLEDGDEYRPAPKPAR